MNLYENWWEEKRAAYLYTIMAEYEPNVRNKKLFQDLHISADKQAEVWAKKVVKSGKQEPVFIPDLRTRVIVWLIKWLGTQRIPAILSAMKIRGMAVFNDYHGEHRHLSLGSTNTLRAAIFGINDGLVSNVSLILGIAGAQADHHFILIAGVAGLLAGACSMAAGEYISVRSQREVFEYQIALEKQELEEYPEEEIEELTLIYLARGIPEKEASNLAKIMIQNPETGLNTLAREELGINPDDLVSPVGAMIASFIAFAVGAAIPLLPFMFGKSSMDLMICLGLTGVSLFIIGALLSLYTNKNPFISGLRMLAIGACAGAITFLIGHHMQP